MSESDISTDNESSKYVHDGEPRKSTDRRLLQ